MYLNGYNADSNLVLSTAQALPNATNVDSTNTVNFVSSKSGKASIVVIAHTAVALAESATLTIKALFGTTSTATTDLNLSIVRTGASGGTTYAAGSVIAEIAIPDSISSTYDWVCVNYATSANESSETVDAFVRFIN